MRPDLLYLISETLTVPDAATIPAVLQKSSSLTEREKAVTPYGEDSHGADSAFGDTMTVLQLPDIPKRGAGTDLQDLPGWVAQKRRFNDAKFATTALEL